MHVTHLALTNFRNYRTLDLSIPPGLSVLRGGNAQGKSNLLEAIHLLAIARSHRPTADIELVHWAAVEEEGYGLLNADVQRHVGPLTVRMGLQCVRRPQAAGNVYVHKQIRVNGVPRRAWELVGQLNAVLFTAEDISLVRGAPSMRRRYLDVLLSQIDGSYLRALQKYGHILAQRNQLLRMVREGRAQVGDLPAWNQSLAKEGGLILERRVLAMGDLAREAREVFHTLTGSPQSLDVRYRNTVQIGDTDDAPTLTSAMETALASNVDREVALGMTTVGPHRDDIELTAGGIHLSMYASRGEARSVALALRLAEARLLEDQRGDQPVLLLDDVLSELELKLRHRVLESTAAYEQTLLTTTDASLVGEKWLQKAYSFHVANGTVVPE